MILHADHLRKAREQNQDNINGIAQ
jgi:hypothetical protein